MLNKYVSQIGISGLKLASRVPFVVLYRISDLFYIFVFYIFRYRRSVVMTNLKRSFPEKNHREIEKICRDYYRNLCDTILETFKTRSMTAGQLARRMFIRNPELPNTYFENGKSVIVLAMHYGNWEWLMHMPRHIRHHHFFVYKPLRNPCFDKYMTEIRSRFGGETAAMNIILKKMIAADTGSIPVLTWLAADQAPPWNHPFWTVFLHQETQFFEGPAKIAQRFDQPVLIQKIVKIRRGYYETWFEVLFENPREVSAEHIILTYVRETENAIREHPELYLWSHRRWKHSRPPGQLLHRGGGLTRGTFIFTELLLLNIINGKSDGAKVQYHIKQNPHFIADCLVKIALAGDLCHFGFHGCNVAVCDKVPQGSYP